MTKLQCWKKHEKVKDVFINNARERIGSFSPFISIRATPYKMEDGALRLTEDKYYDVNLVRYNQSETLGQFKKRSQAVRLANKYMLEHDKC